MAVCKRCGNTTNFNVYCTVKKILEVEIDSNNSLVGIVGDPEDEHMHEEEISIADNDIEFAMVSCAWCGSDDVDFKNGDKKKNEREN